jgi:hypothetical protein
VTDPARRVDVPTLAGGLAAAGVGAVLLLDGIDAITLTFGWLWPLLLAADGTYLMASGLTRRAR